MEVLSGASAHAHNSQVCPGQPELNLKASTGESKLKEISQNGKLGLGETAVLLLRRTKWRRQDVSIKALNTLLCTPRLYACGPSRKPSRRLNFPPKRR